MNQTGSFLGSPGDDFTDAHCIVETQLGSNRRMRVISSLFILSTTYALKCKDIIIGNANGTSFNFVNDLKCPAGIQCLDVNFNSSLLSVNGLFGNCESNGFVGSFINATKPLVDLSCKTEGCVSFQSVNVTRCCCNTDFCNNEASGTFFSIHLLTVLSVLKTQSSEMKTKNMIYVTITLTLLVEVAVSLSPAAKESLTRDNPGYDLEALRERLRRIGEQSLPAKTDTAPAKAENSPTENLDVIVTTPTDSSEPGIEEINAKEGVADYLFQGDMSLSEAQLKELEENVGLRNTTRRKRQWANSSTARWTNNHLFYSFAASVTARVKNIVKQSVAYLQARSCLSFSEDATATDRVEVFSGTGCHSKLGMQGGVQSLSLGPGCDVIGLATHEFIHALGSLHMHGRYDRDDHITVDITNVAPDKVGQFGKSGDLVTINLTPYEYGSVMHYGANTFTTKGYSLKPKIGRYLQTEGSRFVSFYDIKMLNLYYKCEAVCAGTTTKCKNGGFPNPKNCNVCVCPGGYGGALCDQRPAGCGETLVAKAAWATKTFTFGTPNVKTLRDNFMLCNHWISGPANKKIQIRVTALKGVQCGIGCRTNSIEPKYFEDQMVVNPRICCANMLNQIVTSALNPAPIVSYNRISTSTFTFQYRWV
ncbi:hypothetical protein Q1695_002184 [Nippostrongylus brasiliensis]|nr:hypothetical protein Q1695_002184 [Nippostrongylus brasiliensis]